MELRRCLSGHRRHALSLTFAAALGAALAVGGSAEAQTPTRGSVVELRGAMWFDGHRFVRGSRWMQDGLFVGRPLRKNGADSVVSLAGMWIVPPYGDAHTHSPDGTGMFDRIRDMYLRLGVYYVQPLTNSRPGRLALEGKVNIPESVDVAFADAAITSTGGHPQALYESLAAQRRGPRGGEELRAMSRRFTQDGRSYLRLDSAEQIDSIVRRVAHDSLTVVKIMLSRSEDWNRMIADSMTLGHRGLNPALVPKLVEGLHAAGRRVWAHVETPHDMLVALQAGVDGFAHVPGYGVRHVSDAEASRYLIPDSIVQLAGRRRVLMTPTLGLGAPDADDDASARRRFLSVAVANTIALHRAGVRIVTGSDTYADSGIVVADARAIAEHLRLSPLQALRLRSVETPQAIFPGRRIGELRPGYEASFLALTCNPLQHAQCLEQPKLRLKQGSWLTGL